MKTKQDAETDDNEYFWFDVYKTLSDAENYNYYQWDKGWIGDNTAAANANVVMGSGASRRDTGYNGSGSRAD